MNIRLVHRNGEVKEVLTGKAGKDGTDVFIYWPIAGWYHVYTSSGRIAGAKSWRVHPDDLGKIAKTRPKRTRKRKSLP
jgi:hypothetical protein